MSGAAASDEARVARLRQDFPILARQVSGKPLAYLDNAASTQRPRAVIEAMTAAYEQHYANVHRGIHTLAQEADELYEGAREKVRAFINAPSVEQIIFTSGATAAINLAARSFCDRFLSPGDEILLTEMEHHANLVPWQQAAERTGAVIRYTPLTEDGRLDLDAFQRLLGPRTKLVAVTAVSNVLGTINPLPEIIALAHAAGAEVLVDGAQSVPHARTDVQSLDCDLLVFSGHKMLGPTGVGVLYGRRDLLERMPPFLGGGSMIREVRFDGFRPADLPYKFEAGTPPIVEVIGLAAAIDYLEQVGRDWIAQRERQLTEAAHRALEQIDGLRIIGPEPKYKGGIVSFVVERLHPHDAAELLDREGVAVRAGHHCAMPLHERLGLSASTRASFYFYNTFDEIDRLAAAIEKAKAVLRRKS